MESVPWGNIKTRTQANYDEIIKQCDGDNTELLHKLLREVCWIKQVVKHLIRFSF